MVALLLEKGADIATVDGQGSSALHWAAGRGHKDMVALLLDKGADVAVPNNWGETALHWATDRGHKDVATLLEKAHEKEKQ